MPISDRLQPDRMRIPPDTAVAVSMQEASPQGESATGTGAPLRGAPIAPFPRLPQPARPCPLPPAAQAAHDAAVHPPAAPPTRSHRAPRGLGRGLETPPPLSEGMAPAPERPGPGSAFHRDRLKEVRQ